MTCVDFSRNVLMHPQYSNFITTYACTFAAVDEDPLPPPKRSRTDDGFSVVSEERTLPVPFTTQGEGEGRALPVSSATLEESEGRPPPIPFPTPGGEERPPVPSTTQEESEGRPPLVPFRPSVPPDTPLPAWEREGRPLALSPWYHHDDISDLGSSYSRPHSSMEPGYLVSRL